MRRSAVHDIGHVLWVWTKGQFLIWICVTILYLAGFAIVGTPVWALLAILCGLVSVIPHLGSLLGLFLVVLFSFIGSQGSGTAVAEALAVWVVVQAVEVFVIGPRLLGRKLGLNPWVVMLGGIAGAILGGPIGMIIATPILAVGAVLWRRRHRVDPVRY